MARRADATGHSELPPWSHENRLIRESRFAPLRNGEATAVQAVFDQLGPALAPASSAAPRRADRFGARLLSRVDDRHLALVALIAGGRSGSRARSHATTRVSARSRSRSATSGRDAAIGSVLVDRLAAEAPRRRIERLSATISTDNQRR